jgi:hypothetical protein
VVWLFQAKMIWVMPLTIMSHPMKIVIPIPPRKGSRRVTKPTRMSRILRKIDQLTVLLAKLEIGVAASLIFEVLHGF